MFLRELLPGKKSYLVAAGFIAYGVLGAVLGLHDVSTAGEMILQGLGLLGLRLGIAKAQR